MPSGPGFSPAGNNRRAQRNLGRGLGKPCLGFPKLFSLCLFAYLPHNVSAYNLPSMPRFILASISPRRVEVLRNAGFEFEVVPSRVDESPRPYEPPVALAERLAREKAEDVAARLAPANDVIVLGADTVVVGDDGSLLGKPCSPADAVAMLEKLSGRPHDVITGVALVSVVGGRARVAHERTRVFFRAVAREEIERYVATGEPLDKAGAYAIQGGAGRFVTRIEGCYFNVMGLPLALVDRLWREWERTGT